MCQISDLGSWFIKTTLHPELASVVLMSDSESSSLQED